MSAEASSQYSRSGRGAMKTSGETAGVPSVMSSTSPLSPKHLYFVLAKARILTGPTPNARRGPKAAVMDMARGREERVWQATYWVNFHVGEPVSASAMVERWVDVGGWPSRYKVR